MAGGRSLYKTRTPGSLKEAVAQLVTLIGGQKGAAELARVGRAQIARYTDDSGENETVHMPVDIVGVLEQASGDPLVTRFLASLSGCVLLDLSPRGGPYALALAKIGEETGQLFAEFARALANDGAFDEDEAGRVRREACDAMNALACLVAEIDRKALK
jgi:hypothetical protein